jgi:hypothetical protein
LREEAGILGKVLFMIGKFMVNLIEFQKYTDIKRLSNIGRINSVSTTQHFIFCPSKKHMMSGKIAKMAGNVAGWGWKRHGNALNRIN